MKKLLGIITLFLIASNLYAMEPAPSAIPVAQPVSLQCIATQKVADAALKEIKNKITKGESFEQLLQHYQLNTPLPLEQKELLLALIRANNNPTAALVRMMLDNNTNNVLKDQLISCGANNETATALFDLIQMEVRDGEDNEIVKAAGDIQETLVEIVAQMYPPFDIFSREQQIQYISLLLDLGGDINKKMGWGGITLLMLAGDRGNFDVFKFLLEQPSLDVNIRDNENETILNYLNGFTFTFAERDKLFDKLINLPAFDINTPLNALNSHNTLIAAAVVYLIMASSFNPLDLQLMLHPYTSMQEAIQRGLQTLKIYLAHRDSRGRLDADLSQKNDVNKSAFDYAQELADKGYPDVLNLFKEFEKNKIYESRQGALLARSSWREGQLK